MCISNMGHWDKQYNNCAVLCFWRLCGFLSITHIATAIAAMEDPHQSLSGPVNLSQALNRVICLL